MADDLKRVGLIFKEDGAVDFKKTLQEVNIELNKNYNQFKLTQAQWDSSTKSTEKLRAEQEYLRNAYEIQNDKVSTLKMQLADLENAENKNVTAIKKKRNELTSAEVKLENYNKRIKEIENQLNNTGKKIEEFGTKVENTGKRIESAGKKLSAFSAATGAALAASAKSAIDFEDAFAGVEKTVDGTEEQMEELKQGIRDMAKELPSTTTEISAVAEAAGQLGIKTDDILSFTKVMIDLGNSTNLSAEEAASSLAKFANITKMSAKDYDKLGSTIVALGNNFATTEADIVAMATRLAATGELAGLSESQILSLATAMSSVGIEAEAGGSAMSKLLKQIQVAVELGGEDLKDFASIAGMTSKDFKKAFEKDAVSALSVFISGLNDTERNGKSAIAILNDMGIKEVRLSNTVLSLANASDLLNEAVELGNEAWEDNTALTNEANKRYDTLKSKITIAVNKLKDQAITLGNKLMPSLEKVLDKFGEWIEKFEGLSDEQVDMIVKIGLMVTAISPLLSIIGKVTSAIGGTIQGFGTFVQAIGVMNGSITTSSTAVNGLAKVLTSLSNPTVLAVAAIGTVTATVSYFALKESEAEQETRKFAEEMRKSKEAFDEYNSAIDETTDANLSHINSVERLKDELSEIVDENGKVKKGYEARASFILKELNEALGTEYKLNGNIIDSYKDLQDEIDNLIEKKKAEIILSAKEEKYKKAIENEEQAVANLKTAYENLKDTQDKYGMTLDELRDKAQEYYDMANNQAVTGGSSFAQKAWLKNADAIQNVIDAYDDATYAVKENTNIQKDYLTDYELFVEEKYDEIGKNITQSTQDWSDKSLETIKNSIEETSKNMETYKKIHEDTGNEVAKTQAEQAEKSLKKLTEELIKRTSTVNNLSTEEINAWKTLADNSVTEYSTALSKLDDETRTRIEEATGVISKDTTLTTASTDRASRMNNSFDNKLAFSDITKNELSRTSTSMEKDTSVKKAAKDLAGDVDDGFNDNVDGAEWGKDLSKEISTSMTSKTSKSWITSAAEKVAGWISSYLHFTLPEKGPLSDMDESMPDMIDLMTEGIDKNKSKVIKSAKNMASDINNEIGSINGNVSLNGNASHSGGNIDYQKMADAFSKALTNCKFTLDEDGFARIVKDELYKAV